VGDVVQAVPALDNPIVAASIWEQILTAARVQFDYLKLLVIPVGLSTDYSYQQIPVVSTWMNGRVLGFVALMLGGVVLGFGLRKRHRVVLCCIVWWVMGSCLCRRAISFCLLVRLWQNGWCILRRFFSVCSWGMVYGL
jgi:hypothetical protein